MDDYKDPYQPMNPPEGPQPPNSSPNATNPLEFDHSPDANHFDETAKPSEFGIPAKDAPDEIPNPLGFGPQEVDPIPPQSQAEPVSSWDNPISSASASFQQETSPVSGPAPGSRPDPETGAPQQEPSPATQGGPSSTSSTPNWTIPGSPFQAQPIPNGAYRNSSAEPPYPPKSDGGNGWSIPNYDQAGNFQNATAAKPKKHTGLIVFAVIISVVFVLTAAAFVGYVIFNNTALDGDVTTSQDEQINASAPDLTINSKPEDSGNQTSADGKLTGTQIAKKVRPSVVGIVVYAQSQSIQNLGQPSSEGSGIIMSDDGYIITNAHVVQGASAIKVVLDNEEEYDAKLVGSDTRTDLAVIKIDAQNLSYASFGNSAQMEVGETVWAIGNPSGLSLAGSITQGIISATDRMIQSSSTGYTMNCIQTDAAINPGNSGGALVNQYGQVIGINSSKIAGTDYEGIGFAIPINDAKPILESLMKYGYVKDRPRIGITYQLVDETSARVQGVPAGLFVVDVDESCDAYQKGVRIQDIITKIDGKEVSTSDAVNDILKNKKPGDTIKLTIYRFSAVSQKNGTALEITVKLEEDKGSTTQTSSQNQHQNPYGY